MPKAAFASVLDHIRRLAAPRTAAEASDQQLLQRFASRRDEAAFAVLVERHGRLVLAVCRRVLHHEQDAEDAFQASFLVLARKADSIRKQGALAGWLHGVAYRTAMKAKRDTARRHKRERAQPERPPAQLSGDLALRELQALLDEEVNRLPKKYGAPFVLCCLEGKSRAEAALELGWKEGTVAGRIAEARRLLQKRLTRRGVTLSAALCALALGHEAASAAASRVLVESTVRAAASFAAGTTLAGGAISPHGRALAEGVLRSMAAARLQVATLLLVIAGMAGAGAFAFQTRAVPPSPADDPPPAAPPARAADQPAKAAEPQVRTDRYGDPLPPGALARLGTLRFRHSDHVFDIAFAPDGKTLAAADYDNVYLWDAATGKRLRQMKNVTSAGRVAYAPDGKSLATADRANLLIWESVTGRQLRRFPLQGEHAEGLAFSPDGKALAWLDEKNTLRLCDAATGKLLQQWPGPDHVIPSSFSFSPDSRLLALACQKDNDIPLYDTATGKEVRRLVGHKESLYTVAFSPDGKTLASSARDNTVRLWDAATGKELRRADGARLTSKLLFSPDGKLLAGGHRDLRLWDPATGKLVRSCERDDDGDLVGLAFSLDGKSLAASRENSNTLSLWDVASGKKQLSVAGHLAEVTGIAVSPDGTLLATAACEKNYTSRNTVHLWEPATGDEVGTVGNDLGFIHGLAFSPDGRLLAAGNEDGTIRLWDRATRREVRRLTGHKNMVEAIGFSADGKVLASLGYHDRTIRLWDVASGKPLQQFAGSQPVPVGGIALAPDGKTIVQGGETAPSLVLWDAATGKSVKRFGDYQGRVCALALSPDGRTMAVAESGLGVSLWDMVAGKVVHRLAVPDTYVYSLVFSADSRTLATGVWGDGSVRLWEVATGAERCRFVGHRGGIRSGAFSPDGRRFFSGSQDTTVMIWDVTGRATQGASAPLKLSPRALESLWSDLAGTDAAQAHRALWALAAAPERALPLFRGRLQPVAAADSERVARLIADLDSDTFATRDKAMTELRKLGEGARPGLRQALGGERPPELRRRVEQLLDRLAAQPVELFELRAVEALEHIGTPEARQVLERLAGGMPEARLAEEARASLERLKHREAVSPSPPSAR